MTKELDVPGYTPIQIEEFFKMKLSTDPKWSMRAFEVINSFNGGKAVKYKISLPLESDKSQFFWKSEDCLDVCVIMSEMSGIGAGKIDQDKLSSIIKKYWKELYLLSDKSLLKNSMDKYYQKDNLFSEPEEFIWDSPENFPEDLPLTW